MDMSEHHRFDVANRGYEEKQAIYFECSNNRVLGKRWYDSTHWCFFGECLELDVSNKSLSACCVVHVCYLRNWDQVFDTPGLAVAVYIFDHGPTSTQSISDQQSGQPPMYEG